MEITPSTSARPSFVDRLIVGVVLVLAGLMIAGVSTLLYDRYAAPVSRAQSTATAPAVQPTIQPTARPTIESAPLIVQSVPAGEAPQPVQLQPIPAPAPAENAPAVDPAPRPLIIVHQVSADGAHQVITGSGACKVARVAARCSR